MALRYEQMCERARLNGEVKAVMDRVNNFEITWKEAHALLDQVGRTVPASTPLLGPSTST